LKKGELLEIFITNGFREIINDLINEIDNITNNQNIIVMALFVCLNILIGSVYILLVLPLLGAAKNQVNYELENLTEDFFIRF